jgi:hypothetical protein
MAVGRRGVVRDCRTVEIIRELYGGVGADPPCWGVDVAFGWRGIIRRALGFLAGSIKVGGKGKKNTHLVVSHDD